VAGSRSRVAAQFNERLVTLGRLANGRFTKPVADTDTCPASSHQGGGIRWPRAAAALAATALVGVVVGAAASPAPSDPVAVIASPSPTPVGTNVVPFEPLPTPSPTPTPVATPGPSLDPSPDPSPDPVPVIPTPGPTLAPVVIVVQVPPNVVQVPSNSSGVTERQVVTRTVTETTVVRQVVIVTPAPAPPALTCVDPGRHLGRICKRN